MKLRTGRKKSEIRRIVLVNQAVNYLTIDLCNAFHDKFDQVALITGSIHPQGEKLHENIQVTYINKWREHPTIKKTISYLVALIRIYWLLRVKYRRYEVFFISLPPMGYLLNLIVPQTFSMLIWDLYPDVLKITGMSEKHPVYKIWAALNKRSFQKAHRLFTIGKKMAHSLSQYVDESKILITPLWSIFQTNQRFNRNNNPFIKKHGLNGQFIVQYSGNIGLTHKVELMVEMAEKLTPYSHILFQIIGRGPRKSQMKMLVEKKQLSNCTFLPFQSDEMFPYSLSAANLGVVILDRTVAKNSVPSKSYNLMSLGIPSLYIAPKDSELQDYVKKFRHGACFSEDELEKALAFIVQMSQNPKLVRHYEQSALHAGRYFKRTNADRIVQLYVSKSTPGKEVE